MNRLRLMTAVATAFLAAGGAVHAQTSDLPPERAPASQQFAPPARIAPPMNAGERKPGARPETTGQTPDKLRPGRGETVAPPFNRPQSNDDGGASDAHGNDAQSGHKQ